MSLRPDGTYRCDRDGTELENGGVHEAIVVADIDEETGGTKVFHFCRVNGCHRKVLSARNLADWNESRPS